jgi:hypothetical protein
MEYFQFLITEGLYESDLIADRVILQFVFMPILRQELHGFVEDHNAHRIRADHKRPDHVHGRPNDLYRDRPMGHVHGFTPDQELLQRLQESLQTWDFDAYLSKATMHWCERAINGHIPLINEFLPRN